MSESDFEVNLRKLRREKLDQIVALGQQAYPNSYAFTHTVPEVRAAFDPRTGEELEALHQPVSLAGRIMALRVQGKAGFVQLQQNGERLQIYVRKDAVGDDLFALYKLLDLGDHIGVRGHLFRTRTGELTVHVEPIVDEEGQAQPALTFLAKAMLALPDKYHGLEDTELRYRQRYVDLFMNTGHTLAAAITPPQSVILSEGAAAVEGPAVPPAPEAPLNVRETFVKRAAILRAIRRFFDDRGYLEVETPMLHTIAGGAAARPFTTHHNALDIPLSLRIAPELYLKRLVVGGLDRVYEINRNFRNEGVSTRHNPEFTMLEFYQAYANYHDLMDLTQELVTFVAKSKEVNAYPLCNFNGNEIDLSKWQRFSMRQAIATFAKEELAIEITDEAFESEASFRGFLADACRIVGKWKDDNPDPWRTHEARERSGRLRVIRNTIAGVQGISPGILNPSTGFDMGKAIAETFELLAEPHLIQPTIIYDFPLAVSPLSKQKPGDPDWVERFEFYIGGFEVGNAFSELNDPDEQRARFQAQVADKDPESMAKVDEDYVRALGYGLPPTAGEGIGIDRLTMLLTNSRSIRDVILFPLMRPQAKP